MRRRRESPDDGRLPSLPPALAAGSTVTSAADAAIGSQFPLPSLQQDPQAGTQPLAFNHELISTLLPLLTLCSTGKFNIDYDSGRPVAPNFHALLVDARRYRPTRSSCLLLAACLFAASHCGRRVARERLAQYGSKASPRSLGSQRQELAEVCSLFVLWKPFLSIEQCFRCSPRAPLMRQARVTTSAHFTP